MAEEVDGAWFCYMVKCSDGALYVGISNDVVERLEKHNRGFGPKIHQVAATRGVDLESEFSGHFCRAPQRD